MKSTQLLFLLFISVAAWAGGPAKSNFTAMEVNHIRVKTPGLFNGRKSFSIHLDSIKENEYCFPLPGGKVISAYGARRGHSGTDIKTKANDTIRCAFDGIVRMAKTYAAYGNVVVVRHDNGLESIYSHNSRNLVKSGDIVKAGDAVGLTGRTGRATTEHLHLEFRIDGQHFNPNLIFDMKDRTLHKTEIVCTKACKYPHGKCIIISLHSIYYRSFAILIQDKTNQSRYTHQPPVLYPEDQSVSCTQLLFRNNFRNRGPHSRWHQRKANPQYNHNDSGKPPYIQDR